MELIFQPGLKGASVLGIGFDAFSELGQMNMKFDLGGFKDSMLQFGRLYLMKAIITIQLRLRGT